MARLNEVPVAPDSGETLRKRLFRQNRDLARSNNVRALRIKELENTCAGMLSENLELRARIVQLERRLEDGDARRIAGYALAIKARLEAQIEEWGGLIAGLALEPHTKRHSPETRTSNMRRRESLIACRPSPSRRRLRDVAREVEELGSISENKPGPRRSMNQEQLLALRALENFLDPTGLGPPPVSHYLEEEPVEIDSPTNSVGKLGPALAPDDAFEDKIPESPMQVASPEATQDDGASSEAAGEDEQPPSPARQTEPLPNALDVPLVPPFKTGSKRKLAAAVDADESQAKRISSDRYKGVGSAEKSSSRQRQAAKTSKTSPAFKREGAEKEGIATVERRPLANKSTNDDVTGSSILNRSSKTTKVSAADEGPMANKQAPKARPAKTKAKVTAAIAHVEPHMMPLAGEEPSAAAPESCDLTMPITEPVLLAPNTPEPRPAAEAPRGDTPPPADISVTGETLRPSRRSRATISYAEPNLRDKMRRPTKALSDAVAGEGRFAMRARQSGANLAEALNIGARPETSAMPDVPIATDPLTTDRPETIPASPVAEGEQPMEQLPASVVTERRRRPTNVAPKAAPADEDSVEEDADKTRDTLSSDQSEVKEADVYEFTSSPPRVEVAKSKEAKRSHRRQTTSSRRTSTAVVDGKDRGNSRRRSMMV